LNFSKHKPTQVAKYLTTWSRVLDEIIVAHLLLWSK